MDEIDFYYKNAKDGICRFSLPKQPLSFILPRSPLGVILNMPSEMAIIDCLIPPAMDEKKAQDERYLERLGSEIRKTKGRLILINAPETGIFVGSQHALSNKLLDYAKRYDKQFVVLTDSPFVVGEYAKNKEMMCKKLI
jgi:hypothetical protein